MRSRVQLLVVSCAFAVSGLSGCISPAPAMRDDRTAVISGRETAGYTQDDAVRKDLVLAAKMTVDHGFRYFRIAGSSPQIANGRAEAMKPGADVVITVFHEGEANAQTAGIWDAEEILTTGVPGAVGVPISVPAQQSVPRASTGAPPPNAPRCTAYGCNW